MSDTNLSPEDLDLQFTNGIRKQIIKKFVNDGGVTNDIKELHVVLAAADGLDKISLGQKKIKSDEGMNDKAIAASTNLAHILSTRTAKELLPQQVVNNVGNILELDDSSIMDVDIVEGELSIDSTPQNYDTFMNKFSNDIK